MPETLVVNASPLMLLARIEQLELLRVLQGPVCVPRAVLRELEAGNEPDGAADAVRAAPWLTMVEDIDPSERLLSWELGAGETQVIARSMRDDSWAVLDDRAARRCAKAFGVTTIGTLGLVARARRCSLVPAARPILESLRSEGMRLSTGLMDQLLAELGE
ncbi:MAG: DUF3368 domain-containing protein [Deltaproteobacteria bacterium]|nr:DUF3368 domain-containing protein [Deltaproteobacteria bacterium]